jgi:hypothetical protein
MNLVEVLESGRQDFLDAVSGVTESAASTKPAPERWSVLECVEHVVTVEERFQGWLEGGAAATKERDPQNETRLFTMVTDRSSKVTAPEAVVPTGRFQSFSDALVAFKTVRERSMSMVSERGETLYSVGATHGRFGDLNGVEVVHLMAAHARRHAEQIRETRAAVG